MKKSSKELKWYDNGRIISNLIITVIAITIICSQSFAVVGESSLAMFGSVINYNTIYLLVLVYFLLLKFKMGRRYFNYLSLFLIFVYFVASITSLLTVVQSFGLKTLLTFIINLVLVIYLFHTMLRDTRIWKDYKLGNSPFNEVQNDMYFYVIIILVLFSLAVNLISTIYLSGVFLSVLDACFVVLLGRYVFLYRDYLDYNKKDINNEGNFDEIKEKLEDIKEKTDEKVKDILENTDVDDVIADKANEIIDKVVGNQEETVDKKKRSKSFRKGDKE